MKISKYVTTEVDVDVDVDIDAEDVLDELEIGEIEKYLEGRLKREAMYSKSTSNSKAILINLCVGRCRRNLQTDKEEVKRTILALIDEVFD